jgi:hypothetical protein
VLGFVLIQRRGRADVQINARSDEIDELRIVIGFVSGRIMPDEH